MQFADAEPSDSQAGRDQVPLDVDLRDLVARGLLHRDPRTNRFDLHPIVRRYAYERLAAPDRVSAHNQLRDYFAAVPKPDNVRSLDDLAPVIELYHHTVRAGQYDEASHLFYERLGKALFYQLGAYHLQIDLMRAFFPDGEEKLPRLKNESAQAWTLNTLANCYSLSGQPSRAVTLYDRQNTSREQQGDNESLAMGLAAMASASLMPIGRFCVAEANLRRSIKLCKGFQDKSFEAASHGDLGRLFAYRGKWAKAESELRLSSDRWKQTKDVQGLCLIEAYRAVRGLLRLRCARVSDDRRSETASLKSAIASARRALELTYQRERQGHPNARDFIRAHWLLGSAYRVADDLDVSERHLYEALDRCRRINMVDHEALILIDLARLRMANSVPDEAGRLAEEALLIADRCGYVMQSADAHLVLAQLAKDRADTHALRYHATEALRLATCDGPPDYTYKAAYDEATALLR